MPAVNLHKVRDLAFKVREDLLDLYPPTYTRGKHGDMFRLISGKWRFFDEDYTGACGVASYMLLLLARKKGISLDLVGHAHHVWCQMQTDRLVVDPTYGQFNDDSLPVYLGEPKAKAHEPPCGQLRARKARDGFLEGIYVGDEAKVLVKKFPDTQNPFSKYHAPVIQKWLGSL